MSLRRFSRVVTLSVCAAMLMPAVADAQLFRMFDPASQAFITYDPEQKPSRGQTMDPRYAAQVVSFATTEAPGTIIVDTPNKFLYFVLKDGLAIRYGVGVGKEGFGWAGTVRVAAKAEWPTWTPPAEMIERRPEVAIYAAGMPGGPDNPLGARALYLHDQSGDTGFRIHGTNEPWSIGHNVSSGCIRMLNDHVIELHRMAKVGAKVIVL